MTDTIAVSLGEIEAIALKAARGAGMAWGLAEEAAFATRWLAESGVDGLTVLARHLVTTPAADFGRAPVFQDRCWTQGQAARLCPIAAGAALNDHFQLGQGPLQAPVRLSNLSAPVLILPFLAMAAARSGVAVIVNWPGCHVVLTAGTLQAVSDAGALLANQVTDVTVTTVPPAPQKQSATAWLTVSLGTLRALEALVQRTYVPASTQSRQGAGAKDADQS